MREEYGEWDGRIRKMVNSLISPCYMSSCCISHVGALWGGRYWLTWTHVIRCFPSWLCALVMCLNNFILQFTKIEGIIIPNTLFPETYPYFLLKRDYQVGEDFQSKQIIIFMHIFWTLLKI